MKCLLPILGAVIMASLLLAGDSLASEATKTKDAAVVAKQLPTYPLDTCVVAGGKLGSMGAPVNYVHEGRLVRLCCNGCVSSFKKAPEKHLKKIDEAASAKSAKKDAKQFIQYPDDSYLDYQYEE